MRDWEFISIDLSDLADVFDGYENEDEKRGRLERTNSAGPGDAIFGNEMNAGPEAVKAKA